MPVPIAPIAAIALRYGAVALVGYAVARNIPKTRRNQQTEDILDAVDEGATLRRDDEQINATARWRRIIRLGAAGPGLEIDATTLNRIRFRKI